MDNEQSFLQLSEDVLDIIEPTIIFANGGYKDNVHHHLGPLFIGLFSKLILYIVLPILTGIISTKLSNLIRLRGGNRVRLGIEEGDMHVKGKKEFIDNKIITETEIAAIMAEQEEEHKLLATGIVDIKKAETAINALSEFLVSNGWPRNLSGNIANKIVTHIIKKMNK